MSKLLVRRVQHPVGQGGFHTAEVVVHGTSFKYVYDCGAKKASAIDSALASMRAGKTSIDYDWLVISSFDTDHYNGLDKLRLHGVKFKNVFLPHLLDEAFLEWLLCCYLIEQRDQSEIIQAFRILKAIVRGDFGTLGLADGGSPAGPVRLVRNDYDNASGVRDVVYEVKDADWMFRFYSREVPYAAAVKQLFQHAGLRSLKDIIDRAAKTVMKAGSNDAEIDDILKNLFPILTSPPADDTSAQAVTPQDSTSSGKGGRKKNKQANERTVKEILGDEYGSLKEADKRVFADYNALSLCMYSGPRTELHREQTEFRYACAVNGERLKATDPMALTRKVGWIGFGDIGFSDANALALIASYFSSEFLLAHTKMVPHHGAQSNYGKTLAMLAPFFRLGPGNVLWVAAANPLSGYRHPDGIVVLECQKRGIFKLVSEDADTRIEENIATTTFSTLLTLH